MKKIYSNTIDTKDPEDGTKLIKIQVSDTPLVSMMIEGLSEGLSGQLRDFFLSFLAYVRFFLYLCGRFVRY